MQVPVELSSSSAKQRGVRMDELRRFIEVDKHEAVKIGGLQRYSEVLHVVGPSFDNEDSPEAA